MLSIVIVLFAPIFFAVPDSTHAAGKTLRTEEATVSEVTGTFNLILYGSRHSNDIETVAILDLEGDRYTFEPYAPEFDYRVEKGISARKALDKAERFVSWHRDFWHSRLSRIIDGKGNTIGYELRPLYYPLTFGVSDVLDVDYRLKDGKVKVTVRLIPSVERMLRDGDGLKDRTD